MRIIPITCGRATQVHGISYILVATAIHEKIVGVLFNDAGNCCDYACISSLIDDCDVFVE